MSVYLADSQDILYLTVAKQQILLVINEFAVKN